MASYKIKWKKSASKDLRKLDRQIIPLIISAVNELGENPAPLNSKRLRGSEHTYRIRVQDYRVIYSIENQILLIEIIRVGHRKDIYRKFR